MDRILRRPSRVLCAVLVALGGAVFAPGCGQAGTSGDTPGATNDGASGGRTTVQETTPGATREGDVLVGTEGDDVLRAGDGDQVVRGLGGDDRIYGGEGVDRLYGGPGNDLVDAQDRGSRGEAGRDEIFCGPGRDEVLMDADDREEPEGCEMAGVGSP